MGVWSFPHPYISASSVLRPIQYSAKDVLTLVMPHTAKYGINPYISIHMTEIRYIHGPEYITYNILKMCSILQQNEIRQHYFSVYFLQKKHDVTDHALHWYSIVKYHIT